MIVNDTSLDYDTAIRNGNIKRLTNQPMPQDLIVGLSAFLDVCDLHVTGRGIDVDLDGDNTHGEIHIAPGKGSRIESFAVKSSDMRIKPPVRDCLDISYNGRDYQLIGGFDRD